MNIKTIVKMAVVGALALTAADNALAARQGPWPKEKAWEWYNAQPWIRGCNYMPASCANRVDQWQGYGSEERFAEMEREMELMQKDGFNAVRIILGDLGFAVWRAEHDGIMKRFERMLEIFDRHGVRVILVFGNDCSRPKPIWSLPEMGEQKWDLGYHGGRKLSQHGSFPGLPGYTAVDDPALREEFFRMCEEFLTKYAHDRRILFWNLWNEPGANGRGRISPPHIRRLFELAWRIDPDQPLTADIWTNEGNWTNGVAEAVGAELNDIVSYHTYQPISRQISYAQKLKARFGRPMVNTEWLARTFNCTVQEVYPFFAQNRIGCTMWGYVNGKYQTHEPWEYTWRQLEDNPDLMHHFKFTKWFHDLYRPSLRPYDPYEVAIIRHVNAEMDAEREGRSLRAKIAKSHKIVGEDMWQGFRRTKFEFDGRVAWVVEPSAAPAEGNPWTWTMQWAEAFVDRTGVAELLKRGFHHVTIDLFDTRMDEKGLQAAAAFHKFLVEELGFAPKANLIGMSWGRVLLDALRRELSAERPQDLLRRTAHELRRLRAGEGHRPVGRAASGERQVDGRPGDARQPGGEGRGGEDPGAAPLRRGGRGRAAGAELRAVRAALQGGGRRDSGREPHFLRTPPPRPRPRQDLAHRRVLLEIVRRAHGMV